MTLASSDMLGCQAFVWDSLGAPNSMDKTLESFVRPKDRRMGGVVQGFLFHHMILYAFMLMKCTGMLTVQQLAARIVVALRCFKLSRTDGHKESQGNPIRGLVIFSP